MDSFPGLEPTILVRQLAAIKIDYYFGRITHHTDKMTSVFNRAYENSRVSATKSNGHIDSRCACSSRTVYRSNAITNFHHALLAGEFCRTGRAQSCGVIRTAGLEQRQQLYECHSAVFT